MSRSTAIVLVPVVAALAAGCANASTQKQNQAPVLRYVGSSTIAHFVRDAEPVYGRARFVLDTEPESVGGETAIREGRADVAGYAGNPHPETLEMGIVATLIGKDAIAVVVNRANSVRDVTRVQLEGVFTGKIRNWKELGGLDREIRPFIVGPESATRKVFRSAILGEMDYAGCEEVRPDAAVLTRVEREPGAIGQISFSFLGIKGSVKALSVGGQNPEPTNVDYPITRPLYLLWWSGRSRVADFVSWTGTPEAEKILLRRFAKAQQVGLEAPGETSE